MIRCGGCDAGWALDHEDEAAGESCCQSLSLSQKKQCSGDRGQGRWASRPRWQQCALQDKKCQALDGRDTCQMHSPNLVFLKWRCSSGVSAASDSETDRRFSPRGNTRYEISAKATLLECKAMYIPVEAAATMSLSQASETGSSESDSCDT